MTYLSLIIQALSAISTVVSVLWAIHVYRRANENKDYVTVKESMLQLPDTCYELNSLLTEPFFAAIGNSIANELKELHSPEQSMEDFSDFLLNDDLSHNYKALAIYSGLKKCSEVSQIQSLIKKIQEDNRIISLRCPCIGKAYSKLTFYIIEAAQKTISSRALNFSLSCIEEDIENEDFQAAIKNASKTGSPELYFKELAIYITSVSRAALKTEHHGQRTIDLSYTMIKIASTLFGSYDEFDIRKICRFDQKKLKRKELPNEKHAVEDAMQIFRNYRSKFNEEHWEKLIECKGRIVELMEL